MSTAVLLWVWLNCAGRILQTLYPLHAAAGAVALDEYLIKWQ